MYTFHNIDERQNKIEQYRTYVINFFNFVWNSETKEFCGRDGLSWAKISLFYGVFYAILSGFFIGLLAVFSVTVPTDKPKYYGQSSVISSRGLNPGLGFRPQIDPEDFTIKYEPSGRIAEKYIANLNIFLNDKYDSVSNGDAIDCYDSVEASQEKSCKFDYRTIYENTDCMVDKKFGYDSYAPCVLIKVNKVSCNYSSKEGFDTV